MSTREFDTSAHRRKRVRFATDDSSEPSMSDESLLASSTAADDSTAASDYDSDSDSTLSESSEDPSSDESSSDDDDLEEHHGNDGVINLRAGQGKKPTMRLDQEELGPDIRTFLKDFLPQLKAANEELEKQRQAGTLTGQEIDATEAPEGEPYIEMDLGLGVLEEKDPNAHDSSDSEGDEDVEDAGKEKDVLGKLMGRESTNEAVVIQEVQDARAS